MAPTERPARETTPMAHRTERIALTTASPGTARHLAVHRFGTPGARPKAYVQAGLHADEIPGMLVAHHLCRRLAAADARGEVTGEVVLVPAANPIGLSQWALGMHLGRFESGSGGNFNRDYPDLAAATAERVTDSLGDDADENVRRLRNAMLDAVAALTPKSELEDLRLTLMRLAVDADIALDLHCDLEALCYFFTSEASWPDLTDLAAELGARAVLLATRAGGNPFDEALSAPWIDLAERFAGRPVPQGCHSATIELRGTADVGDALAADDAAALLRLLQRRGVVAGDPGPLPDLLCEATPLSGADSIAAPAAGIVALHKSPGDHVEAGDVVADIVDPTAADPAAARTPVVSRASGLLYSHVRDKLVRPGQTVANVAGPTPLPHRSGNLLEA